VYARSARSIVGGREKERSDYSKKGFDEPKFGWVDPPFGFALSDIAGIHGVDVPRKTVHA